MKAFPPRIVTLGLDLKQTPGGKWGVIELNGMRSGIDGVVQLTGYRDLEEQRLRQWERCATLFRVPGAQLDTEPTVFHEADLLQLAQHHPGDRLLLLERVYRIVDEWSAQAGDEGRTFREYKEQLSDEENPLMAHGTALLGCFGFAEMTIQPKVGLIIERLGHTEAELPRTLMERLFAVFPIQESVTIVRQQGDPLRSVCVHPEHFVTSQHFPATRKPVHWHSIFFEQLMDDKWEQKRWIIPKEYQASSLLWQNNLEEVRSFLDVALARGRHGLYDPVQPFVVVKPRFGSLGKGVRVHRITDWQNIAADLQERKPEQALIELFVASKDITSVQGNVHDACMRLLVDYEVDARQKMQNRLFCTGYWRLSPRPANARCSLEERHRANFHGEVPAIPKPAGRKDMIGGLRVAEEIVALISQKPLLFYATHKERGMEASGL